MNAEQYLKEHEEEALKKIAQAVYPNMDTVTQGDKTYIWHPLEQSHELFSPRKDAEQWIECLMWYRSKVWEQQGSMHACHRKVSQSVDTRIALLVAILDMIGGWDE